MRDEAAREARQRYPQNNAIHNAANKGFVEGAVWGVRYAEGENDPAEAESEYGKCVRCGREDWHAEFVELMGTPTPDNPDGGTGDPICPTCIALDEARRENERLREAAEWYVRCLRDVIAGKPVRGLDEARAGFEAALSRPAAEGKERRHDADD